LAGLKVQQLLEEPSAAIMAYGPQQDEKILVYDLGGGTFDVTIIDCFAGALTIKAVFGNNLLGGDDFDRRLMDHLRELIKKNQGVTIDEADVAALSVLKKAAETAKIEMSRRPGARITIPKVKEVQGRPIGLEVVVKTPDFNAMIRDLVEGTLTEVEKALNHAKLDKSDIDTVLLVGGSTYYPLVQETVRKFFGKEPNKSVNPDLAVAMGAAASLVVDKPPEGGRHVVTVGFVPERTPEERVEIRGRTTPGSQVRVTGGTAPATAVADDEGEYTVELPLKKGINTFVITSVSPNGEQVKLEPEPILHDETVEAHEEPPAPPAPILPRALSVSCALPLAPNKIITDHAVVIIEPQSALPKQATSDGFATSQNNQAMLMATILEGDLPVAGLNTKLAELTLQLPPNVPANERVSVHFTVDENSNLTAELEVPSVNRRGKVVVNLKSLSSQLHLFQQVENLYTQVGGRIRPEQRAAIEQARVAIEDLSRDFAGAKAQGDVDRMFDTYTRIVGEAQKLRTKIDEARRTYA
jgi:molecular chaperone DnaK (HSP70)